MAYAANHFDLTLHDTSQAHKVSTNSITLISKAFAATLEILFVKLLTRSMEIVMQLYSIVKQEHYGNAKSCSLAALFYDLVLNDLNTADDLYKKSIELDPSSAAFQLDYALFLDMGLKESKQATVS